MPHFSRLMLAGISAASLIAPSPLFAQTTAPSPAASMNPPVLQSPAPSSQTAAPANAPAGPTNAPAPSSTSSGSTSGGSTSSQTHKTSALKKLTGTALKKLIKPVKSASLTPAQVDYAMTHQSESAQKLSAMKTVSFNKLGVYHLTAAEKAKYKVAMLGRPVQVAELNADFMIAQTGGTVLNQLHNVLANVNVSDALNNVLNNSNVNVNANVSLQDVLNHVNIGVGQVVGIYIGTGGSVTTIAG